MSDCDFIYKALSGLHGVGFHIDTDTIHHTCSPTEYYNDLLAKLSMAKESIVLCSLYIGDGDKESAILDLVEKKLVEGLDVVVVLDGARQLRSPKTHARLLGLTNRGFNLRLSLFRNAYDHWGSSQFGTRLVESLGVSHIKLLVVDDISMFSGYSKLLMTRANLSDTYFVDRQDQCMAIHDHSLSKYLRGLLTLVAQFSDHRDSEAFRVAYKELNDGVASLPVAIPGSGVMCFPVLSLPQVPINTLASVSRCIFTACSGVRLHVMTPYFNLPAALDTSRLLDLSVYTSSPASNGFRNCPGFSRFIPFLYLSNICKHFEKNPQHRLYEYANGTRTFHAKGLHALFPHGLLTTVGSSNWNHRSLYRDNELELVMVSQDEGFVQKQLRHLDTIKRDFVLTDPKKYNADNLLYFRALSRALHRFL